MMKITFFDVDEKEQALLSKEFARGKAFELRFNQKHLDKHTACIEEEFLKRDDLPAHFKRGNGEFFDNAFRTYDPYST